MLALLLCAVAAPGGADTALHPLWELHGRHNTVYLLGSIHTLRPEDYPLAPAVLAAYADAKALVMEVDLSQVDVADVQAQMLASATLPEGTTLPQVLGRERYGRAANLAREVGIELSTFDRFAPWFAAEAISELQLTELGFQPQSGVEMYFLERAKSDGKRVAGLETIGDQIALFDGLSMNEQSDYLLASLEEAQSLPKEVADMVRAWRAGDTAWFERQLKSDLGRDPKLYESVLAARNRRWIPKIEALLDEDRNYLVIVGTGHLVGRGGVIELLRKDGVGATQR
jgi:uncharacterized protein YbaP (TraB family)